LIAPVRPPAGAKDDRNRLHRSKQTGQERGFPLCAAAQQEMADIMDLRNIAIIALIR